MYFEIQDLTNLLSTIAEKFSGGEMMFDGSSKFGLKFTNRRTRKAGKIEMLWKSFIEKNFKKQFENISPNIKAVDGFSYWDKTVKNPQWHSTTQKLMRISTFLNMGKFVRIQFTKG